MQKRNWAGKQTQVSKDKLTRKMCAWSSLTLVNMSKLFYPAIALDTDANADDGPASPSSYSPSNQSLVLSPAPDFALDINADDHPKNLTDLTRLRKSVQRTSVQSISEHRTCMTCINCNRFLIICRALFGNHWLH